MRTYVPFLCLFGAYTNAAAYGFDYPKGPDYAFLLPLANWLRDASLYPGDPIKEAFLRHSSVFWPLVVKLSSLSSTEHVLFALFIITKVVFFLALGTCIAARVSNKLLGICITGIFAVSPLLNGAMPLGASHVLGTTSEQGMFGIAFFFLAGACLVEGRWIAASIIAGTFVYIDALQFLHTLPAFALFAIVDWRKRKLPIFIAGLLGAVISLPWLSHSFNTLAVGYPQHYVDILLAYFPLHSTLHWTPAFKVFQGTSILVAAGWMAFLTNRYGYAKERRLEYLALSYGITLIVGVSAAALRLTPSVARMCLLRADSFAIPYALLLIQIYGATLLVSRDARRPHTTFLLGLLSVLLPLSFRIVAPFFFLVLVLWSALGDRIESFADKFIGSTLSPWLSFRITQVAPVLCACGIVLVLWSLLPAPSRLWNFTNPVQPAETACYEAQTWARSNTPREARFLVPPKGCGFRILSERSSWGEWVDGTAIFFYTPFANIFATRMASFGLAPGPTWLPAEDDFLEENYKRQSWDSLRAIALKNDLDYIVQFRSVIYPAKPVYENRSLAIYRVNK